MTFVVDASTVVAWCYPDETSPVADIALDRLEREGAIAPAHWPLEIANALRAAERRGRLDASDLLRLRALMAALPVEVVPVELTTAIYGVVDTAREQSLSAYDAVYLDLAAARGLPLATVDDRLREACGRAGVDLVA